MPEPADVTPDVDAHTPVADNRPPDADEVTELAPPPDEVDGYAAGAVACAFGSFVVPIVLAVAALILARASEVRRGQLGLDEKVPGSSNATAVQLARVVAWANIVLVGAFLIFLLLGIAARVAA